MILKKWVDFIQLYREKVPGASLKDIHKVYNKLKKMYNKNSVPNKVIGGNGSNTRTIPDDVYYLVHVTRGEHLDTIKSHGLLARDYSDVFDNQDMNMKEFPGGQFPGVYFSLYTKHNFEKRTQKLVLCYDA